MNSSSLNCIYLNARSLVKSNAIDALSLYCRNTSIDVVCVTETWCGDSISDAELSCGGLFDVFRRDRRGRGGGVAVLISRQLHAVHVSFESNAELLVVELGPKTERIRICCCYIPPSFGLSRKALFDELSLTLDALFESDVPLIVLGDFNVPGFCWNTVHGVPPAILNPS